MILHTLLVRPYVFVFLIAFLVIGSLNRGVRKTIFFLFSGYLIAWISEAVSIRTGFPYGWYFYRYENLQGEWLNFGVPVWDSLSYTFLCFAGMSVAEYVIVGAQHAAPLRYKILYLPLLSALFVTILDIIVDPLAHRGSEWFLGDIYYYPSPGFYFGVPLSNFAGWFLVSFLIVGVNVWFENKLNTRGGWVAEVGGLTPLARRRITDHVHVTRARKTSAEGGLGVTEDGIHPLLSWITRYGGIGLYFGVFAFNLIITLWIEAWLMALMALLWISIPVFLFYLAYRRSDHPRLSRQRNCESRLFYDT